MLNISKLRKQIFAERYEVNRNIINYIENGEKNNLQTDYNFLKNPFGQIPYLYLTKFTMEATRKILSKNKIIILDWGSGKGQVSYLLKEFGDGIEAISADVETKAEDSSFGQWTPIIDGAKINVQPLKHEYILPFEDEYFDVVLSFGVLEHVPNDYESLKEIRRVLKSNGLFFCFFLPYRFSWTQNVAHWRGNFYHDRLYGKRQVNALLESSGFEMLDFWHRSLLPHNTLKVPFYHKLERIDNFFCQLPLIKHLATNIEFAAQKRGGKI